MGNRTTKTDMDGKVESYSYDDVYRLTQANYPDGTREAFTYDPVGNRKTRSDEAGVVTSYTYDEANQMLTAGADTFQYDPNGSMTKKTTPLGATTLVYDTLNRVTSISGPDGNETNIWAPDGRRAQMTGTATQTTGLIRPIYDLTGNPIADADSGQGMYRYRVYGPGIDEPLAEVNLSTGGRPTSYLHHDALNSITLATNPPGTPIWRNSYRAFGQRTFGSLNADSSYNSRLSYTSRENSVGSLYQYRSRYYDTAYGRFAKPDEYRGTASSVPSLHRYVYTMNNPVRYADPSGYNPALLAFVLIEVGIFLMIASIMYCIYHWQLTLSCATTFAGGVLVGVTGSSAIALVSIVLNGAEFFLMYMDGDLDVVAFALIVIAIALSAAIGVMLEVLLKTAGAHNVMIGMISVAAAVLLAGLIKWAEYANLEASRRGVYR